MPSSSNAFDRSPSVEPNRWFSDEVYTHDGRSKAYLTRKFPGVRDLEDVVQESYLRPWKARAAIPANAVTAFLFHVARNVVVDRYRLACRRQESAVGTLPVESVLEDMEADVVEAVSTHENELLLAAPSQPCLRAPMKSSISANSRGFPTARPRARSASPSARWADIYIAS